MLFRSDGTKIIGWESVEQSSAGYSVRILQANDLTGSGAVLTSLGGPAQNQIINNNFVSPAWYQLRNDGTNIFFDYGYDGVNFVNFTSQVLGAFITPTSVAFGGLSVTSGTLPFVFVDLLAWNVANNATL